MLQKNYYFGTEMNCVCVWNAGDTRQGGESKTLHGRDYEDPQGDCGLPRRDGSVGELQCSQLYRYIELVISCFLLLNTEIQDA